MVRGKDAVVFFRPPPGELIAGRTEVIFDLQVCERERAGPRHLCFMEDVAAKQESVVYHRMQSVENNEGRRQYLKARLGLSSAAHLNMEIYVNLRAEDH